MNKRKYIAPNFEVIRLDKDISLQLQSPTTDPGLESYESAARGNSLDKYGTQDDSYTYENW